MFATVEHYITVYVIYSNTLHFIYVIYIFSFVYSIHYITFISM